MSGADVDSTAVNSIDVRDIAESEIVSGIVRAGIVVKVALNGTTPNEIVAYTWSSCQCKRP